MSSSTGLRARRTPSAEFGCGSPDSGSTSMIPLQRAPSAEAGIRGTFGPASSQSSRGGVDASKAFRVTNFTISIPDSRSRQPRDGPMETPRWKSWELIVYCAIVGGAVTMMIVTTVRLSQPSHPNWSTFAPRLTPGWLFGRPVDNSDAQYRSFRSNLPGLLTLAGSYLTASIIQSRISATPTARLRFIAGSALVMLIALHGVSAWKVLAILGANYRLVKSGLSRRVGRWWPALLIAGNMGVLLLNDRFDGYDFAQLHPVFDTPPMYHGVLPRWHLHFNISMLRIVSFALDHHWRQQTTAAAAEPPSDHRSRTSISVPDDQYSLLNLIAYCLYPPLYIAGPIMTFNDFMWQQNRPLTITLRERISYLIRFIFCFITMETILHTMYVVAIKDTKAWDGDSPAELSMIGFWNLVIVWLKLLIPWRFFRLWALSDGVDPPENMIRCVANNYSTMAFWRSWHRSYNLWVVRYIYIPVGGSKNAALATLLVFTFVALWHDLSFKLLAWGWLVSLFILPEMVARTLLPYEKYGVKPWYRHVAAFGGVLNILMLMSANLVGFVLGLDGMKHLIQQLTSTSSGWLFSGMSFAILFVAVHVMFEYRNEERQHGIDRKC